MHFHMNPLFDLTRCRCHQDSPWREGLCAQLATAGAFLKAELRIQPSHLAVGGFLGCSL